MQSSGFIKFNMLSTKSLRLTFALALLSLFGTCFFSSFQLPATAKSGHRSSSTQRNSESLTQEAAQTYRPPIVSRAYSRVIGGVHVKRNSDGTVETYEAPSRPVNLYPTVKPSKSARHSK
ncbi:hypothetical protein BH10CYA1_BH10CYA1_24930 [soil metagenome]